VNTDAASGFDSVGCGSEGSTLVSDSEGVIPESDSNGASATPVRSRTWKTESSAQCAPRAGTWGPNVAAGTLSATTPLNSEA